MLGTVRRSPGCASRSRVSLRSLVSSAFPFNCGQERQERGVCAATGIGGVRAMYGDVLLLERPGQPVRRASRLPVGDTGGRTEAWLRDLFQHPELLPVGDIDPAFGPLLPLCRELRTDAE